MLKKHWSQSVFECRNKLIKIPYKTCRILIILEPETQNGLQNDQKSIRFSTMNHMEFRHVEKPYKTCQNEDFWEARNSPCELRCSDFLIYLFFISGRSVERFPGRGPDLFFSFDFSFFILPFFISVGRSNDFLAGARTANQQSNSRALRGGYCPLTCGIRQGA